MSILTIGTYNKKSSDGSNVSALFSLVAETNGKGYALASSTPSGATGQEVATANWSIGKFVKKTGDTMTGDLSIYSPMPTVWGSSSDFAITDTVTAWKSVASVRFKDKNNQLLGGLFSARDTNGYQRTYIACLNSNGSTIHDKTLVLAVKADGTTYAEAPTPSSKTDNSAKIATTAWVNQTDFLVHTTGTEEVRGFKKFTNPYWNVGGLAFKDPRYGISSTDKPLFNGAFKYLSQFPLFDKDETIISNDIVQTNADNSLERVATMRDSTNTQRTVYSIKLDPSNGEVVMKLRTNTPSDANSSEVTTANWVNTKVAQRNKVTNVTSYAQLIELIKSGKQGDSFGITMDYVGGSIGGIYATDRETHAFGHYTIDEITVSDGALTGLQAFGSGEVSGKLKNDDDTTYTYATTGFGRQAIGSGIFDAFRVVEDGKLTYFVPNGESSNISAFEGYYLSI